VLVIDRAVSEGEVRQTKTNRIRTVEIVGPLRDDLDSLRPSGADPGALVAPGEHGQPLDNRNWATRSWLPACRRAGIRATPYEGRHTFASLLFHEGRPIPYVTASMGHASAQTTLDHYAHVYELARHDERVPMAERIAAERTRLAAELHSGCTGREERHLRLVS
jgi:integrase